jgi:chromosome segregation ATPase
VEDEEKHPVFLLKADSTHGDAMSQMNFDQVKDYLQGRGEPSIARDFGGMNLAEMKSNFGDNELELKRLQKDLVQKRQREMADDIRQLQVQQQKTRTKKNQNEVEIANLIKELQVRKQEEMEMELRKVKISRELKQVDQKVLVSLEQDGKRTLDHLQKAKADIAQKEREAQENIQAMTKAIADQEQKFRDIEQERKDALGRQKTDSEKNSKDAKIQTRLNKASEHGERMAVLKRDRAALASQLQNVESSFAKMPTKGEMPTGDALEDMVSAHKVEAQVPNTL